jgi:hypothetical protein
MNPSRTGVAVALVATLMQAAALAAQTPDGGSPPRMPLPQDWSHRHLIYSAPTSIQDAVRLQNEPRYWHQWLRRSASGTASIDAALRDFQNAWQTRWAAQARGTRVSGAPSGPGLIASSPYEGVLPTLDTSSPDEGVLGIHRDWGMSLGTGGRVGQGMFPAKFSFDVNATPSCVNDFVVFNTSLGSAPGDTSIIAFNQLYSTQGSVGGLCKQDGPSVLWAYNTDPVGDTTGTTVTSPVLSLDGARVMYVETRPTGAILHILKWKSGQGTLAAPAIPDLIVPNWGLVACPAANSCIVNLTFNGTQPDTNSAPYYDYSNDALYVGDDNGSLHKFHPVLTGTPAEVTSVWPITVHSGQMLSGPVFDAGSDNIFVGDSSGQLSYVKDSASNVGSCLSGVVPCLGTPAQALGGDIVDAPIVDSIARTVFAFDGTDVNNGSVYQFDTQLSAGSKRTVKIGGNAAGGSDIHAGTFDNTYLSSASGTGYLFVCGKDSSNADTPAIHRIAINSYVMNTTSDGSLALATSDGGACSPVSEVYNTATSTDWIFFSVGKRADTSVAPGCSSTTGISGCLMALNLKNLAGAWPPAAVDSGYPVTSTATGGSTSGIVVDNIADPTRYPQASSIYFTFQKNAVTAAACNGTAGVGCAVKLTQSGLQ